MGKKSVNISDLHFEHKIWNSELTSQKEELNFLKNRLEEVVPRYTDNEVLAKAEQFQNQLLVHGEVIDILVHDINGHEHLLSSFARENPVDVDHVHFDDHTSIRDRVEKQRMIYAEFKQKFFRYLTDTM